MITKEYRIPMPLCVEEYRIAQLYMIAKKSRLESEGEGSGVEILANEPYTDGPGGCGQYTDKLYHIGAHLPVWLRGFLPKSLSTIKEEAWNAYPYSRNKIFTPFMDRFSIEIESKYLPGGTKLDNVFELDDRQKADRIIDVIDFVSEKISVPESANAEDPLTYVSQKTGRGPLTKDWLISYENCDENRGSDNDDDDDEEDEDEEQDPTAREKRGQANECSKTATFKTTSEATNDKRMDFMCVYKICRVTFDRWPIQHKVEQYIHDYIRKTLFMAHRQAWSWQDEWFGLSMEQIRAMERETEECLAKMMRKGSTASSS